ncbi:MAG: M42 family metallopeptidase [Clostridia bacterium]|nr:M42 family metallopeptidase [Clostridia bacterium]
MSVTVFENPAQIERFSPVPEEELIRALSEAFGPTGCEAPVREVILSYVRPLADSILRDSMGNLICLCRFGEGEDRQRVMISAHMDEVGMMVTEITEEGYCRFDTVGGIMLAVMEGRKVTLGDETKRISGVIASKAIHHKKPKDRKKPTPIEKLYIDIGAKDREEAEKYVSVGTLATFDSEWYRFGEGGMQIKGKALDDRLGCAVMIQAMKALRETPPEGDVDLYFCFTVREEIGLSGAKVVANRLKPDVAIVLECTAVSDLAEVPEHRRVAMQGKGGALSLMDRSTVYDRDVVDFALDTAEKNGIPVQIKKFVSGGNDAGSIHKSGKGVKTLALSVPTRYLHSPACVANLNDVRSVTALCEALLRRLSAERI